MRRSHRLGLAALLLAGVSGLGACTGGGSPSGSASPTPADTGSSAAASATPSPSGSPSPTATLATLPAKQCLTGDYTLVRFVAASNQTYGTGEGGDLTVAFTGSDYTLTGAGKKPVQLTLAGTTAQLTVDGKAQGTWSLDGSTATFKAGSTSGSGTVSVNGQSKRLSMDEVSSVIGLEGKGEVACTKDALTITFTTVRLELARA